MSAGATSFPGDRTGTAPGFPESLHGSKGRGLFKQGITPEIRAGSQPEPLENPGNRLPSGLVRNAG